MSIIYARTDMAEAKLATPPRLTFLPEPDAPQVAPPEDYGYGDGTTWAPEQDAFYVLPVLRTYYADPAAEPSDILKRGYMESGSQTTELRPREVVRAIGMTDERDGAVVHTTHMVNCLITLSGPEHYPRWLHDHRLHNAIRNKQHRDVQTHVPRYAPPRCVVCGTLSPAHGTTYRELSRGACRECRPVLDAALAAELAARTLADGRTIGEAAQEAALRVLDGEEVSAS